MCVCAPARPHPRSFSRFLPGFRQTCPAFSDGQCSPADRSHSLFREQNSFPQFARGGFECGFIPEPSRPAAQRLSFPQAPRGNHRLRGVCLSGGATVPHQEWPVPSQRHRRAAWRAGNDVWTVTERSLENPGLTAAAGRAGVGGCDPVFQQDAGGGAGTPPPWGTGSRGGSGWGLGKLLRCVILHLLLISPHCFT